MADETYPDAEVTQMAARTANEFQRNFFFETLAGVLSRRDGGLFSFLFNENGSPKELSEIEIMRKLESLATHPEPDRPENKGTWWHAIRVFVGSVSSLHVSHGDPEKLNRVLKQAYENEGLSADFKGIDHFFQLVDGSFSRCGSSNFTLASKLFLGRPPETPYCWDVDNIKDLLFKKVEQGVASRNIGLVARMADTLLSLDAPDELLHSGHVAMNRQFSSEDAFPWIPQPRFVLRYHQASVEERDYLRNLIEVDRFWKGSDTLLSYRLFQRTLDSPKIYSFLSSQVDRGTNAGQLWGVSRILADLEGDKRATSLMGIALTGKRTSLDEILEDFKKRELTFIGGTGPMTESIGSHSPLPSLVKLAKKYVNPKVTLYFRRAVESDVVFEDLAQLAGQFSDFGRDLSLKVNPGKRAYFSSCCYGQRFKESQEQHMPVVNLSGGGALESSVIALRDYYLLSGLQQEVVIGKHKDRNGDCFTAAFVNKDRDVMHLVIPHSMMFDRGITDENCSGCDQEVVCNGINEYVSAVLFDPESFGRGYLEELAGTVPGAFELHTNPRGVNKLVNFVAFPDSTGDFYFNPLLASRSTPIQTGKLLGNLIAFPMNLDGSVYLARNLRERAITGEKVNWMGDESVVISKKPESDIEYAEMQKRMDHSWKKGSFK